MRLRVVQLGCGRLVVGLFETTSTKLPLITNKRSAWLTFEQMKLATGWDGMQGNGRDRIEAKAIRWADGDGDDAWWLGGGSGCVQLPTCPSPNS